MQTKMKALGAGGYFIVCPSPKAPSKPRDQAEAADVPLSAEQSSPMMYSLNPAAPTMLLMRDGVQPLRRRSRDGFQHRGCVCKVHTSNIFLTFCGQTFVYMEIYIFLVDRAVRPVFIFLPSFQGKWSTQESRPGWMFLCNHWTSISPVILPHTRRHHCLPALSWCCSVSAS